MKQTKTMYGVEHAYSDGRQTYEIFPTLKEAETFASKNDVWNKNHIPLFIFKADFNIGLIYTEDGKHWNYEDFSDTIAGNFRRLKETNQYPDNFEQ